MRNPTIRLLATDQDLTPGGSRVFGGWTMSYADLAASIVAVQTADGDVVTVSVENVRFLKPINVGDIVSFYAVLTSAGKTSMKIDVDVVACRSWGRGEQEVVATSTFIYVSIDKQGNPRPLQLKQD